MRAGTFGTQDVFPGADVVGLPAVDAPAVFRRCRGVEPVGEAEAPGSSSMRPWRASGLADI